MSGFDGSLDHLLAEARRIDLMLRREVIALRGQRSQGSWDEFRGLYISEEEIDSLLSSEPDEGRTSKSASSDAAALRLDEYLRTVEETIREQRDRARESGAELRLEYLRQAFGLTAAEVDTIVVALLPDLDLKYQRLFAYLQDDVTRKEPTVDLVLRLIARSAEERLALRAIFLPQGQLLTHRLVSLVDARSADSGCLLEKAVRVEERVVDYLLGWDEVDVRLAAFASLRQPQVGLSDVLLPPDIRERIQRMVQEKSPTSGVAFFLQGPRGAGKRMTAEAVCHEFGMPLLIVDIPRMLAGEVPIEVALQVIGREALLQKGAVYWDSYEALLEEDKNLEALRARILEWTERWPGLVFLGSRVTREPQSVLDGKPLVKIDLPTPGFGARRQLWGAHLDSGLCGAGVDLEALASKFRLTGGQIRNAVANARNMALARGNGQAHIDMEDLQSACRAQSNQKLSTVARKIRPKFTWEDIVLPNDQMAQLREITNHVRYKEVVYGEWSFEKKLSLGLGLNVLFAGPSGTGKTMAAEIISGELGLDLYRIDLSTVVSKYIGETEKNLDKIFREAQDSNAILFFDEADALFGKRSEVRDSHDRYANIEIAYLLQKMEEYDGIVILATNLRKNLDEAFARRMHFSIEFPSPEEEDRYRIWQRVFPKEAPVSEGVDLKFMASQFKITGGNIKNIALGAAFLAASDGRTINMEHLIKATKREYQKIGRLCTETDFGPYFDLVKS